MSCTKYYRMRMKKGSGKPTIPSSTDHRNGDWLDTDVYVGEQYMDKDTGLIYTRTPNDEIVGVKTNNSDGEILYKARLTQIGTSAPVVTEYINNTGVTITAGRPQVGVYSLGNFPDLFDGSNYEVVFSEQVDEGVQVTTNIALASGSDGSIQINTYDGGVLTDGLLKGGPSGSLNRYNVITIKKY